MPVASASKLVRLADLDQSKSHTPEKYREKLRAGHLRLLELQHALKDSNRSVIIIVEGPDAAGKGGMIKRLVERLDPRHIRVYSTIKPTDEEYAHHYLWRFWNKLPRRGEIAIFDRSWYGRILVERIEGFCSKVEWRRAYREINEFERVLHDDGTILIKIWLQITKQEQMARFKKRAADPMKNWKITRRIGATATGGTPTSRRPRTCSSKRRLTTRRGRSSRRISSGMHGSKLSIRFADASARRWARSESQVVSQGGSHRPGAISLLKIAMGHRDPLG